MRHGNAVEATKASKGGDPLRIRDELPDLIARGCDSLTKAEKDLLKWLGLFARARTPGKFMLRIRMPNGFTTSAQFRAIADLSDRLGNCLLDLTTRQQVELRGFTLETVPEIFERLRQVDLRSLQTGMDNVRNINRIADLMRERLLTKFSPSASPFVRGLVTCIGTDFCNLALIDTKGPALALAKTLEARLGSTGAPLTMHWSGCQAGCGNHQAADIGFRGHRASIDGKTVEAVAVYVRGRTGPHAAEGEQILDAVAVDALPDVVEGLIQARNRVVPIDLEMSA